MFQFISRAKSSKWFWYGLLAIVVAIDIVLLARYSYGIYRSYMMLMRIYRGIGISLVAALLVAIFGGLLNLWQQRNQQVAPRKLILAWCWGALRGGLIASLIVPLLVYEEFQGPRLIIFAINTLQGCPSKYCIYNFLGPLTVLVFIPFGLGLTAAIVFARKFWRKCTIAAMD
jgi:hypothetical protein